MTDIYLHTADEQAMLTALTAAGLTHNGKAVSTHDASVAMIGTLSQPTGQMLMDDDGIEYPEYAPIPGYHCNVRTDSTTIIDALASVTINVTLPSVEWAWG